MDSTLGSRDRVLVTHIQKKGSVDSRSPDSVAARVLCVPMVALALAILSEDESAERGEEK
jgi:hypothetical protein